MRLFEKPPLIASLNARLERRTATTKAEFIKALQALSQRLASEKQIPPDHIFTLAELEIHRNELPILPRRAITMLFEGGLRGMLRDAGLPWQEEHRIKTPDASPFTQEAVEETILSYIRQNSKKPSTKELALMIEQKRLPSGEAIKKLFRGEGLTQLVKRLYAKWDSERGGR